VHANQCRYLLAENHFDQIQIFEQRSSVGGAWNYSPSTSKIGLSTSVPHLNPHEPVEKPTWIHQTEGVREANFLSPLYDRLETNIPKELMRYSDQAWPADAQLFPKHPTVKQYLEEYAEDIKSHIQFETQVLDVNLQDAALSTWSITTRNLQTGNDTTGTYDAVVVASGHFSVPYVPDIPGIKTWDTAYPGVISHSKFYDSPEIFQGKKVVAVGSSASALDIGAQINEFSKGKLLVSQRSESWMAAASADDKLVCPEIVEFLPPATHDRGIRFADGRIEEYVDAIVFCTGYFYSYPFLSSLNPPAVTHGWRTMNVYQQLFYIEHPTLVFPVLSQRVIPFPMAENQAALFSRVWSARLTLPSKEEMKAWEMAEIDTKGDGKKFHLLPYPMDADYLNLLYEWAQKATPRSGLSNNGQGKLGTWWGERERWMRALFPEIRRAFVQRGNDRGKIKTLAELGFVFEEWKEQGKL
jgi:cation diffusion facilitator CzcD-associated flavoprotein CzcO